jgi:hypothetical protein
MFRTALQPHSKNKMTAQQDERRVGITGTCRCSTMSIVGRTMSNPGMEKGFVK